MKLNRMGIAACCVAVISAAPAVWADDLGPITAAIEQTKPLVDVRLRYENVEQTPFLHDADAATLRARLGFETGKIWGTSLLAEGDFMMPLDSRYNSTTFNTPKNANAVYPVVADPEDYSLNRLQFVNTSIPGTTVTLGRQRINLDDQRFIGNSGWRQNEQTFDALRIVNKGVTNLTVDVTYINRVNRIYGPDGRVAPNFAYLHGEDFLANASYHFPVGSFTAFDYLLSFNEIPQPVLDSTQTYGFRFAGDRQIAKIKLTYVASVARQEAYKNNPLHFSNNYYAAELTATSAHYSIGAGIESLGGDGTKGFATLLATLHKFEGWADKFLVTPVNGIDDRYATLGALAQNVAFFQTLSATAVYHSYQSERLGVNYGSELDLQFQGKWHQFTGTLKYAEYRAAAPTPILVARGTTKLWAQVDFIW